MKIGNASGLQIAFFTFAGLLLLVPVTKLAADLYPWTDEARRLMQKSLPFIVGAIVLWGFPALRRRCREELSRPIPDDRKGEVAVMSAAHIVVTTGGVGAFVAWTWFAHGPMIVEQRMRPPGTHEELMARAFTVPEMALVILIGAVLAPVIEELVFRGFLYRAWERRWGWIPAMVLSSALFLVYHQGFGTQFVGGLIYVCLLRRTGTLWAPIVVHSIHNLVLWYPLLGQHILPADLAAPGDLASWPLHLAFLVATIIIMPAYIWMARDGRDDAVLAPGTDDAALSR